MYALDLLDRKIDNSIDSKSFWMCIFCRDRVC